MNPSTNELQNRGARPLLWVAGAVGAGVGIASWAYKRRRRNRWEAAKSQAERVVEYAREELKPWMGVAVGTAAAGTAVAVYARRRRRASESAATQAGEFVSRAGRTLRPWAGVAVNAAISLASAVYNQRSRKRTNGAIRGTQKTAADLADRGRSILRLLRQTSEATAKRHPRLRRLIA
jgi:hypothetical protein